MHLLKTSARNICALSVAAAFIAVPGTNAGTVINGDPVVGGIGYRNQVTLGLGDFASFTRHIGAWSWEDSSLFGVGEDPVGWTHTSDWTALTLTATTTLTIRMERQTGVAWPSSTDPNRLASIASLFPSFTLWSGWDNDLAPQAFADANNSGLPTNDWHMYNNDGAIAWAEDLTYVGHINNTTQAFAEVTFTNLPAGQYSLVLGSNAPADDSNRQGYLASFTTVPEPASAAFLAIGALSLGARRHRLSRNA